LVIHGRELLSVQQHIIHPLVNLPAWRSLLRNGKTMILQQSCQLSGIVGVQARTPGMDKELQVQA